MMRLSRRLALALWLLFCLATPSWSALPSTVVWEVRGTVLNGSPGPGADTNGGGFVAGATGTDYSQQNAAQFSGTDLAVDAVTNTKVTSATHNFVGTDVGDLINVSAGVGYTTGIYQIVSVAANAATLDRSPAAVGVTGGTWAEGGALATLGKLAGAMVASNKAFATGAFAISSGVTFSQSVGSPNGSTPRSILGGYGSTRNDGIPAVVTMSGGTVGLNFSGTGWDVGFISVDCALVSGTTGIETAASSIIRNCKVSRADLRGIWMNGAQSSCIYSEVSGCTVNTTSPMVMAAINQLLYGCNIHDNSAGAATVSASSTGGVISRCLVVNNAGSLADGIGVGNQQIQVIGCTIHNNGRDGIRYTNGSQNELLFVNNILTSNGGYGLNNTSTALPASTDYDGNAYLGNTSGARNNLDSTAGIFGVNSYTNTRDVTLTVSPYVGPTTGSTANFALNSTSGGGAACKGAGSPGTWPGNTGSTGYLDLGAVQTKAGGGGPPQIISGAMGDGFSFSLALLAASAGWKRRKARQIS